jgi:hypothetical protein
MACFERGKGDRFTQMACFEEARGTGSHKWLVLNNLHKLRFIFTSEARGIKGDRFTQMACFE